MTQPLLYLASASPRRQQLLQQLGYQIKLCAANIDETPHLAEIAHDYVLRMAIEKNRAARALQPEWLDAPIISADTTVAWQQKILGKPLDAAEAYTMLAQLSGCTHQVLTAVCVFYRQQELFVVQQSHVEFKVLSEQKIHAYIATGEPLDKAGAYAIQGIAGTFVRNLSGSFTGVMGLPMFETVELLRQSGASVPPFALPE